MRTTIRINDALLSQAKLVAAESGCSLTALIEDSLRESLFRRAAQKNEQPPTLPVEGGQGVHAGVNLYSNSDLADWMEKSGPG